MQIRTIDQDKQGNYHFNNLALAVKPHFLTPKNTTLNSADPEEIEMAASSNSARVSIYSSEEGILEITHLSCYRTAACLVDLADDARKQRITGRPCHVDTVFGDGQEPFLLNESLFLRKNQSILMQATDLSADANDIRPVFTGQRVLAERARDEKVDNYIVEREKRARYVLPFLCPLDEEPALSTSAEADYYYTQQSIAHFEVRKLTFSSSGTFKFKITDETGTELTNDWIHSSAVLGTAMEPFILPTPWVIQAGGKVRFRIKDLGTVSTNTIYMTLCGRSLFVAGR